MLEEMNVNVGEPNKAKGQDVQEKREMNQAPIKNHPVTPYIPKAPYPQRLSPLRQTPDRDPSDLWSISSSVACSIIRILILLHCLKLSHLLS
ncbi:hypothetical protein MRB53_009998 [Persea americana]|uniref:Uncharacterized protein n=1 Tax=Persea americana TaxID=3435 RepID=A0ACC2LQQ0_PERAE|nr:hypothetical protein MRB53_009998 [Persea americana]